MATNPTDKVYLTKAQLTLLKNNESITVGDDTYTADENALYLIDDTSVSYELQSLTSEQQTQARTNIGAGTSNFSGSYDDLSNKPTIPTTTDYVTQNSSAALTSGGAYTALLNKENTSNKVTSLSSSSTDNQYPSAKCVYDLIGDVETLLTALNSGSGV